MLSIETISAGASQHVSFLFLLALFICVSLAAVKLHQVWRQGKTPRPHRPGHSEDSFVHHLAGIGLSPRIARTTYRYLRNKRGVQFPILMGDSLTADLNLDSAAILETIRSLLIQNGRRLSPFYRLADVETVGDLVGFIQSAPRTEEETAIA